MSVIIRSELPIEEKEMHLIYNHYGFTDSDGKFFLITNDNIIVLMTGDFLSYNLDNEFDSIEYFLKCEFNTTLVRAYKQNDFDITINLK